MSRVRSLVLVAAARLPCTHCARVALLLVLPCGEIGAAGWGGSLGFGSDVIQRGSSLTDGRPGWQADLRYAGANSWVVGIAATAERPPGQHAGAQLTAYADRRWRLAGNWSAKLGVVHYESPWNRWRPYLRYNELNAAIGWRGRWRLSLAVSPDSAGLTADWHLRRGVVSHVETSWRQPLGESWSAHAGAGYADLQRVAERAGAYASAGLVYAVGDVQIHSTLFWTDRGAQAYATRPDLSLRWVNSLAWRF